MSLPVFPSLPGLSWTIPKASEFSTLTQDSGALFDTRVQQAKNPRWHWGMTFDVLRDGGTFTEYRQLQGLILSLAGSFGDFLYSDPSDNTVGPALIAGVPNTAAQLQVVNDGAGNYYSPIQRNFGGLFQEDITDLNGSITVYDNAVLKTGGGVDYTLAGPGLSISGAAFEGMYLQWAAPPTGPVTAEFNFYFRCHFEEDTHEFEQFLSSMWTVGGSESKSGSGVLRFCTSKIAQI
ncbi:MAG: DUF2460 domain-containing protein [Acidobacteria bacterium]|nr:DUF2460 domain-containing protein [Acidobacteriota bacterium]